MAVVSPVVSPILLLECESFQQQLQEELDQLLLKKRLKLFEQQRLEGRHVQFTAFMGGCLLLLVLFSISIAARARQKQGLQSDSRRSVKIARVSLIEGFGWTQPGDLEEADTSTFTNEEILAMALDRQDQQMQSNPRFIAWRDRVLLFLLAAYAVVCLVVPTVFYRDLTCEYGLPWEVHLIFLALFIFTKCCELWIYHNDPVLGDTLPLLLRSRPTLNLFSYMNTFEVKFGLSFVAYFDAYQDAVATATAYQCPTEVSQQLAPWMMACLVIGVVFLQWGVVTCQSFRDPTRACLMKLLHMDTVASRITLPLSQKKTWTLVQIARTIGEDVPQAILQTFFVLYVKDNPFMVISICCAVGSSALALKDAVTRTLLPSGGVKKQLQVQVTDKEVHSLQCYVLPEAGVFNVIFIRRSGRAHCEYGPGTIEPNQPYMLHKHEYLVQVNVAFNPEGKWQRYLKALEFVTSEGRRKTFGEATDFDFKRSARKGQQIVGLISKEDKHGALRITGVREAELQIKRTSPGATGNDQGVQLTGLNESFCNATEAGQASNGNKL